MFEVHIQVVKLFKIYFVRGMTLLTSWTDKITIVLKEKYNLGLYVNKLFN